MAGLEEGPLPQLDSAPGGHDHNRCQPGEGETHQRSDEGQANIPLPQYRGGLRLLDPRFVVKRDSGERQQDHGLRDQSDAAGSEHVSAFMGSHTSQDDGRQRQVTRSVGGALTDGVVRPENKHGQDEEGKVDADVDAEQTSYRNGPATHKAWLLLFYMDG